jgi:hypothetical protein
MQIDLRNRWLRRGMTSLALCLALATLPLAVAAADIVDAWYDPSRDELIVDVAYRGSTPDHEFSLSWAGCGRTADGQRGIAARLIDTRGEEPALGDYRIRERFSLATLECRPAEVMLRLVRISNAIVFVPGAAGGSVSP